MLLLLEFPQAQRFASEQRVLWSPLMISEICCQQPNSQIVSLAGQGLELSYDQAVQDMYDPGVSDVSEVLQGRGLSDVRTEKTYSVNKPDIRSTANEAGRNAHVTGERSPVY
jgi:hypothetical protein